MNFGDCGGCQGMGSHRRWCYNAVGMAAANWGRMSERAESLADSVGGNDPALANLLYEASGRLLARAKESRATFQANHNA